MQRGLQAGGQGFGVGGVGIGPAGQLGEGQAGQLGGAAFGTKEQQLAGYLLGTAAAAGQGRVHGVGIVIQCLAVAGQQGGLVGGLGGRGGAAQGQSMTQVGQHGFFVGLVAVQLQAGRAQAQGIKAALHYFEGRHFLGHEQHRFARPDGLGQQVSNGLRLARARRPLNQQVAPLVHRQQRQQLRRVGIEHLVQLGGGGVGIQQSLVAGTGRGILKTGPRAQQRLDGRVAQQRGRRGPAGRVEVAVEQQLRK